MRRSCFWSYGSAQRLLLTVLLLSTSAWGDTTRRVTVNLTKPCRLSYQIFGGDSVDLGYFNSGSNLVSLPTGKLVLRARGSSFTEEWSGSRDLGFNDTLVDLPIEQGPNTKTIIGALVALLFAAGALQFLRLHRKSELEQQLAELQEPLIRSDGALPKRKIGNYRATAQLGAGGMGVVYKAVAPDGFEVAIKVPAPHLIAEQNFRDRFMRELELAHRLKHPRIIALMGLPESNEPYIVLEFLQGQTMESCPRLPWHQEMRRCLAWLDQALEGLVYVHGEGVIHRDLKPANIMVLKDGSIKLMDFGIAHKLHGTKLTGTDTILGTPTYMAPEQLQGLKVDARTDLYALGLIFYERLAGGLPFPEELVDVFRYKLSQELPRLRTIIPEIPLAFDDFIARLVAIDPDFRFPDAATARQALPR